MKNYVCSICGSKYDDLNSYLECVAKCGETVKAAQKAEAEKERLEKVNAELNRIKEAKEYYDGLLKQFKEEYPNEYELNFGKDTGVCPHDCKGIASDDKSETVKFSYKKENDEKPKIRTIVNGKDVSAEKLLEDPSCRYIAKMLGII